MGQLLDTVDLLERAIPYALRAIDRELLLIQRRFDGVPMTAVDIADHDRVRALRAELLDARLELIRARGGK